MAIAARIAAAPAVTDRTLPIGGWPDQLLVKLWIVDPTFAPNHFSDRAEQ